MPPLAPAILDRELADFRAEVQRLALALVAHVFAQELARWRTAGAGALALVTAEASASRRRPRR